LHQTLRRMAGASAVSPASQATEPKYPVHLSFSPRSSFAQAVQECGEGYSGEEILEKAHRAPHAWLKEMQDYMAPLLASFGIAAMGAKSGRLRVLDFGGGNGVFKAYAHDFFDRGLVTDWTVVETPAQVELNSDVTQDGLRFSTSIGSEFYDFAVFSGSLQYVDDWQSALRQTDAGMLFISRTPIGSADKPFIQSIARNGRQSKVPGRVIPRSELFAVLAERYDLFASWDFKAHLMEMGLHDSPAMVWRKKPALGLA
jgi:putative methyltransferase (TIGR04325 family)